MNLFEPSQYQLAATKLFSVIAAEIQPALPFARIEHVGSSAIPGAISKGDIDICVAVPLEGHESAVLTL